MNIRRPLFLLSGLLLGAFALASCAKDEETAQIGDVVPAGTTIRFDLSGEIESDLRASDVTIALTPTGSIAPSLEGKTTFPGKLFITDNAGTTTSHSFTWDVVGNRLETTEGTIAVTFDDTRPAPFTVRVIAGDIPNADEQARFANTYSAWIIDGQKVNMDIPFYAEATVPYNATTFYSVKGLTLKPIGFFVRCQIANQTGVPVTVKDLLVYSHAPLQENGSIAIFPMDERLIVRPFKASDGVTMPSITIPAGQTSTQSLLIWVAGFRYANVTYSHSAVLDIRVRPDDRRYSVPIYSEITLRNAATHRYASGKVYKTTIYLRKMPNPLSRLSEYPVHKSGTKFVTDWNDYNTITNPDNRLQDFEVGFFDQLAPWNPSAINIPGYSGMYGHHFLSIFPTDGRVASGHFVKFSDPGLSRTDYVSYVIGTLPRQARQNTWNDPANTGLSESATKSFYRLVLMGGDWGDNRTNFHSTAPGGIETTDHLRFAYRYTWNKPGFPTSSMVIEARYVGHDPAIVSAQDIAAIDDPSSASYDPTFWNTAEHRVFPAYGALTEASLGIDWDGNQFIIPPRLRGYRENLPIDLPNGSGRMNMQGKWESQAGLCSGRGFIEDGYYQTDKRVIYLYKQSMD